MTKRFRCSIFLGTILLVGTGITSTGVMLAAEDSLLNSTSTTPFSTELSRSLSDTRQPLPQSEAFALTISLNQKGYPVLDWQIEEGYYLYRKSLTVQSNQLENIALRSIPAGEIIEDEFFGEVEIYRHHLQVELNIGHTDQELVEFVVNSQGCAENQYCYPIQSTRLSLYLPSPPENL